MSPPPSSAAEPTPSRSAGADSPSSQLLSAALELALEWAPAPRAVFLSGSHAAKTAVWVEHLGRAVTLSDVDLYVLLDDEAECRAAGSRRRLALGGLAHRCLGFGLAAPLEAGFHTPEGFARLPARPGTIDLGRHGRVIRGQGRLADLVPRFRPADVGAEEIALLLENRGCELLWCRPRLFSSDPLTRLQGRHAVLKCALDLAGVMALLGGEYPDGLESRVAWARENRAASRGAKDAGQTRELDRLWDLGLSWRRGAAAVLEPAEGVEEWMAAVRGWVRAWWETSGRIAPRAKEEPIARAFALARRARLRRRLRQALTGGGGNGHGRWSLLAHSLAGTLQHRVHASAALLLLAADAGVEYPLAHPTAVALERLGVVPRSACSGWEEARRAVVVAWDRWLLDGQRTADPA